MHDFTKNGLWLLKVTFTYDLDNYGRPLTIDSNFDFNRGQRFSGIYTHFSIESEDRKFRFHIRKPITRVNSDRFGLVKHDPVETTTTSYRFYTKDKDMEEEEKYLASRYGGGWWFDTTYQGFSFCANCQRDLVMNIKIPGRYGLADCIWKPKGIVGNNPSEISMWMLRVD